MKIANQYGLPDTLVSAVSHDFPPSQKSISVTELIGPPQIRQLRMQHWNEIEEDVSDRIWALLGTAIHAVLEKADTQNHLVEEALKAEVNGLKIVGHPDLYKDGILSDYKICGTYAAIFGIKPEWEAQLNCYAWLYKDHGFPVTKIQNVLILRDWQEGKKYEDGYPKIPVKIVSPRLWDNAEQWEYLQKRVAIHSTCLPCTDEERWKRPEVWAVMKKGMKKAVKLCNTEPHAEYYARGCQFPTTIEHRPSVFMRCSRYCQVSTWCPQCK